MFRILAPTAVAVSTAILAAPVLADGAATATEDAALIEDVGGSQRINFAGKLRMLTQRIAASACYDHAGIAVEDSEAMLIAATAEFDQIIAGLEFGDDSLGIHGEEQDRRVLMDIQEAHAHWDPVHSDIDNIVETGGTDEELLHLTTELDITLGVAVELVHDIVAEYADPASLLQSDAITIDIAGRQRMLAQRVSKNVCLLSTGVDVEGADEQLANAVRMYQTSLMALRNGFPDAGVEAPPTEEVAQGLDAIIADWEAVQPIITTVMEGGEISAEDQASIFYAMNSLTGQMNTLVGIYAEESKLGL